MKCSCISDFFCVCACVCVCVRVRVCVQSITLGLHYYDWVGSVWSPLDVCKGIGLHVCMYVCMYVGCDINGSVYLFIIQFLVLIFLAVVIFIWSSFVPWVPRGWVWQRWRTNCSIHNNSTRSNTFLSLLVYIRASQLSILLHVFIYLVNFEWW